MNPALALSVRLLRREWRSGDLKVLAAALVIAVASVCAVGFFTDRLARAMESGATELLGADLVVHARTPIATEVDDKAAAFGLDTARTVTFRSIVHSGERLQLAEAKFVSSGYPLRGQLRVADEPFGADRVTDEVPGSGEVWVDARLAGLLEVGVGDVLEMGRSPLRITRILAYEPSGTFYNYRFEAFSNGLELYTESNEKLLWVRN